MDLSSINSALLPLQNSLADQTSMGGIAAEDGQKADVEASGGTGQDLPTADAAQAASATSGASSASLSPEMQALLLQTQEASAAASFLLDQNGGFGDDPMLAAISGGDAQENDWFAARANSISTDPSKLLSQLQGTNSATPPNGSTPDTSQGLAQIQALLADFMNSASANGTIDASNQALTGLMDGVGAAELAE